MDVQRPIRNQRVAADWGRSVADALQAGRLDAPGATRTPVGTTLPPAPAPAPAERPERRPFGVRITAPNGAVRLTVKPGRVVYVADGVTSLVPYSASDFATRGAADGFDGATWEGPSTVPAGDFWVFAEVAFSGFAPVSWTLRAAASLSPSAGRRNWPVAFCAATGSGGLAVDQLKLGYIVVTPGDCLSEDGAEGAENAHGGYPAPGDEWVVTAVAYDPSTHILSYARRKARVVWADAEAAAETVVVATAVEESC